MRLLLAEICPVVVHLLNFRFIDVLPYSGKFSWDRNFRDFRDQTPTCEKCQLAKISSHKNFLLTMG